MSDNLLLKDFTGPYGGVPAFDQMKVDQIQPAVLEGIEEGLIDIETIAKQMNRGGVS